MQRLTERHPFETPQAQGIEGTTINEVADSSSIAEVAEEDVGFMDEVV